MAKGDRLIRLASKLGYSQAEGKKERVALPQVPISYLPNVFKLLLKLYDVEHISLEPLLRVSKTDQTGNEPYHCTMAIDKGVYLSEIVKAVIHNIYTDRTLSYEERKILLECCKAFNLPDQMLEVVESHVELNNLQQFIDQLSKVESKNLHTLEDSKYFESFLKCLRTYKMEIQYIYPFKFEQEVPTSLSKPLKGDLVGESRRNTIILPLVLEGKVNKFYLVVLDKEKSTLKLIGPQELECREKKEGMLGILEQQILPVLRRQIRSINRLTLKVEYEVGQGFGEEETPFNGLVNFINIIQPRGAKIDIGFADALKRLCFASILTSQVRSIEDTSLIVKAFNDTSTRSVRNRSEGTHSHSHLTFQRSVPQALKTRAHSDEPEPVETDLDLGLIRSRSKSEGSPGREETGGVVAVTQNPEPSKKKGFKHQMGKFTRPFVRKSSKTFLTGEVEPDLRRVESLGDHRSRIRVQEKKPRSLAM